jgi:tRNA (adenine22-N1)-methyltransferase
MSLDAGEARFGERCSQVELTGDSLIRDCRLKPRLSIIISAIAEAGRQNVIYDIGTDHAYMPIEMVRLGLCDYVVATDVGSGPLKKAERNVRAAGDGVGDKIALRVGDGFAGISDYRPGSIVVISGMGGIAISQIVSDGAELARSASMLALQPMNNHGRLRAWLIENGYGIADERHALEGRRAYVALFCKWTGSREQYAPLDYLVGKRVGERASPSYLRYMRNMRALLRDRRDGLAASAGRAGGAEAGGAAALLRELDARIAQAEQEAAHGREP